MSSEQAASKVHNYKLVHDPETGLFNLVPADAHSASDKETFLRTENAEANKLARAIGDFSVEGLAYYDQAGKLKEVFPLPQAPEDQEFLIKRLQAGGSVETVSFWPARKDLPTPEEVRGITEEAINSALLTVCRIKPRPEKVTIDVALEADFRISGKFAIQLDWMPARDCAD